MSANPQAPGGAQQKRLAAYLDGLAHAAGHADRINPLKSYCTALLLPGERKSVEPMAARLAPNNVRRMHQSLHHVVADAPWSDEAVLHAVRDRVLPAMKTTGPVVAWIIDDTGFPKKGTHSVGVARQYCGQLGKQENCRVAVSLSVATWDASLPVAYRLYLPESWVKDRKRRRETGVPKQVEFQTKPRIALEQIRQALASGIDRGVVLADAGYGSDTAFRDWLTERELPYVLGINPVTSVWEPGTGPLPPKQRGHPGRPPKRLRRDPEHRPIAAHKLALQLPSSAWKTVTWREGSARNLKSRFAAARVRPAHCDDERTDVRAEEWLLVEWPRGQKEPTKYWLSTLPVNTKLRELIRCCKHRWIIERDYEELKQELGLGHYEGRGWRGFHHHATLCIAAYGFLVRERSLFSPSARAGRLDIPARQLPPEFQPRGRSAVVRTA